MSLPTYSIMKIFGAIFRILSRYGWTATLIVLGAFAVGFTWSSSDELYNNIRLFDRAAVTISADYVENLDDKELIKAGIDGMLSKLDPYSRFLSEDDFLYLKQETEGEFEGVGVALGFHHDSLTVESVMEGTPGYYRGILAGDRIVSIDGKPTANLNMRQLKMMLRGQREGAIAIGILRPDVGPLNLQVERAKVTIKAIPFYGLVNKDIGYIRLARFSSGCTKELHDAIRDLKRLGMNALILDLRDNPGGLLLESVEISSMFLPEKSGVVETRGKGGLVGESYVSSGKDDFQTGGLAILVDSLTASAAEIVAGAIQDHDRGVIIGCSTFGKGLVQQVTQFSDNTALKLTTAKYYLPSGRCLQKPDWSTFELVSGGIDQPTDSLYRTTSGRAVIGGGGIIPDIYVDGSLPSDYLQALKSQSCIFDFALSYLKSHKINPKFKVDSAVMAEFKKFIADGKFQYMTDGRQALLDLTDNIKEPSEKLKSAFETIDQELSARDAWQFDSHYSEIAGQLQEAMISQAFGETVLYQEVRLSSEPEILEALHILSDNGRYAGILAIH